MSNISEILSRPTTRRNVLGGVIGSMRFIAASAVLGGCANNGSWDFDGNVKGQLNITPRTPGTGSATATTSSTDAATAAVRAIPTASATTSTTEAATTTDTAAASSTRVAATTASSTATAGRTDHEMELGETYRTTGPAIVMGDADVDGKGKEGSDPKKGTIVEIKGGGQHTIFAKNGGADVQMFPQPLDEKAFDLQLGQDVEAMKDHGCIKNGCERVTVVKIN